MSAFNLGSIRAVLGIETGGYTKGLLDAQVANEVFGQSVVNFVNNPLLGSIGLLKDVAAGTASLVKETAFHNQELLRTADRLGASTELVSGLQGAYKGFGQDGAAVERQLTKLNQQIGEAASGNVTAQQMFDRLSVSLRDQNGQAREFTDIFRDVSDALGRTENQSVKVAIAQKLFGEDVSRVIDIIGRGTGVLEGYLEQARKLGEVFSREQVESADRAASALDNVNRAFNGLKTSLAQGLITGFIGDDFDPSKVEDIAQTLRETLVPAAIEAGEALRVIADNLALIGKLAHVMRDVATFGRGNEVRTDMHILTPDEIDAVNRYGGAGRTVPQAIQLRDYIQNFGPLKDAMLAARMSY